MVVEIGVLLDGFRQNPFVYVAGGEVSLAEIGRLVRVVQFEVQRFGNLIIFVGG